MHAASELSSRNLISDSVPKESEGRAQRMGRYWKAMEAGWKACGGGRGECAVSWWCVVRAGWAGRGESGVGRAGWM